MTTPFPRGIEVLLNKAAVDSEFRDLLLNDPNKAAESIELELQPAERVMMQTFPKEQLSAIIDRTEVPESHRRAFLGTAAAAMIAIVAGSPAASAQGGFGGARADVPPNTGRRYPYPYGYSGQYTRNIHEEVRQLVAEAMNIPLHKVNPALRIVLDNQGVITLRKEIYRRFDVRMPLRTLKTLNTVRLLTNYIVESLEGYEEERPASLTPSPQHSPYRGIQPK